MAFGYKADGSTVNITKKVDWKSSDPGVVQIDANGLAVVTDSGIQDVLEQGWAKGKITISCSYPKSGKPIPGSNYILLKPHRRPKKR